MLGNYFGDLKVGDEFTGSRRTITEADIVIFTSLSWLFNPGFTDEEFAKEKGFGTRIPPGPLTMCFAMGLTDELIHGTVVAALGIKEVTFAAPVKPGDTISVKTIVTNKRESTSHPDRGLGSLRHDVHNQRGEQVCTFERTLMFLKGP